MISRILAALLAAAALPALAQDPPKCRLIRIAEWPVRMQNNLPIIEGSINGKKIGVLLDTGAFASLVMKSSAERLDLPARNTQEYMIGFGGESRVQVTRIEELRIGEAVRNRWVVRVAGERPLPGVDFILGDDFFRQIDLEFDYAKGVVRLFQPENCKKTHLGYWDPNALQLPLADEDKIIVPVKVNGRAARAMIDSGASSSVVSLPFAASLGIAPDTPGVLPANCSSGIGAATVQSWVARFDALTLAEENIRDPLLPMAEYMTELAYSRNPPPEVILGTDFLRTHRVMVARSQQKMYFSYTGGQVFPNTPGLGCDERRAGKSGKEALAAYDQAIAANPNDAKALLQRSLLRRRGADVDGALADLDAALRIEPKNALAYAMRAPLRAQRRDLDGAFADTESAIANGMHNAQIFVTRGEIRRSQRDCPRAIPEYEEALKLEPLNTTATSGRDACLLLGAKKRP